MVLSKSGFFLKDVSKIYNVDNKEHKVIENISLDIESDEITVILGESGCGKTTLLRILAGLESTSSGEINYLRNNNNVKPKIGMVFQESRLMDWLNVEDNISFHGEIKGNDIDKYIDIMKLKKFRKSYPHELSGGMAQRVSIARALSYNPDILLMDEPFSALDYFTRKEMQKEVINLHKSTGKGVIFVTHDIEEAMTIAKKIIVFTKNKKLKIFNINEEEIKDLNNEYYTNLRKDILITLQEEV